MNISSSETVEKRKSNIVAPEPIQSKDLILNIKGIPTLSNSHGKVVATCPMSNSQIRSYFKKKLARNPRNATISMVVQTWKKVHEAMHAVKGKKFRSQLPIDYLNKCFVIKEQMEWWITNCATSGAPDDFTYDNKHAVFLVEKECTRERLEEWICTGSFKQSVSYPYWEDPKCPIPQYDINKLPKKEMIWMGKPWVPEFMDKSAVNVSYDLDKTTGELDPYMLNCGNVRVMFD